MKPDLILLVEPDLILLVGIPGSGKSSWLKKDINTSYAIICPDELRKIMFGDVNNQMGNTEVWEVAKQIAGDSLREGKSVILDATNVDTIYRRNFIKDLPSCRLLAKFFPVSPEEACNRIHSDIAKGINRANVPDHIIYRMFGDFLYTEKVIRSEGFEILHDFRSIERICPFCVGRLGIVCSTCEDCCGSGIIIESL